MLPLTVPPEIWYPSVAVTLLPKNELEVVVPVLPVIILLITGLSITLNLIAPAAGVISVSYTHLTLPTTERV